MDNKLAQYLPRRNVGFAGVEGDLLNEAALQPGQSINSLLQLSGGGQPSQDTGPAITNASLGYAPRGIPTPSAQGTPIDVFGKRGLMTPDGSISGQNPDGSTWKAISGEDFARQQAAIDKNLAREHIKAQTAQEVAKTANEQAKTNMMGMNTGEPPPKAPPGTRVFKDADGNWQAEVIHGTKQWQDLKSKESTDRAFVQNSVPTYEKNINDINSLITHEGFDNIFGRLGGIESLDVLPSTREARAKLAQAIGAMETSGFNLMKSTSGSAGSMSQQEWPKMQTYFNIIKNATTPEQAKEAFKAAQESYKRMSEIAKEGYQNEWGNGQFGDKSVIERLNKGSALPTQNNQPAPQSNQQLHDAADAILRGGAQVNNPVNAPIDTAPQPLEAAPVARPVARPDRNKVAMSYTGTPRG